ncbi:uncharacterized protein LOC131931306 [Physella acuta]|uniref:uncharacterized protein LOC131931306 n=1 Tax=Physella acuta TaxID=109671 RepID=UPI0027DDBD8E|nr:uncharacterized protein LOC131931306 [Physella acuta]
MDYRPKRYISNSRIKDPFFEKPLPKSFYHPSPVKEADEHEAIRSPERKVDVLGNSNIIFATTLPQVKSQWVENGNIGKSDQFDNFDETWPENEKSSSFSTSKNESNLMTTPEASPVNHNRNLSDIVQSLGTCVNRTNNITQQMKYDTETNETSGNTAESVLQKYIERFRNSAPKPREERVKERETTKQDFWWLNSSPGSVSSSKNVESISKTQKQISDQLMVPKKLTKEALLEMDQETLQLQMKADRLLSQSELSLASSGPIVSTEGLGSSASISDFSASDDQPPYRPSFIRNQESYSRPASNLMNWRQGAKFSENAASPSDDILVRWRLNRKMGELQQSHNLATNPTHGALLPVKTSVDPRLEEFRKKLLSQKAQIISEDIHFERQRMAMMLEEHVMDKKTQEDKKETITAILKPLKDPILERLSQITGSGDNNNFSGAYTDQFTQTSAGSSAIKTATTNANFNNACAEKKAVSSEIKFHEPELNRNNTASSANVHDAPAAHSNMQTVVHIDHFRSQVVCEPMNRDFVLEMGDNSSCGFEVDSGDSSRTGTSDKTKVIEVISSGSMTKQGNRIKQDGLSASGDSQESDKSVEDNTTDTGDNIQLNKHNAELKSKDYEHVNEKHVYHQFLEAEKPNAADQLNNKSRASQVTNAKDFKLRKENLAVSGEDELKAKPRKKGVLQRQMSDDSDKARSDENYVLQKQSEASSNKSNGVLNFNNAEQPAGGAHTLAVENGNRKNKSNSVKLDSKSYASSSQNVEQRSISTPKSVRSTPEPTKHQVQAAIGQTVLDHMFQNSTVISSVDSWASMFPQSPVQSQSLYDNHQHSTPSTVHQEETEIRHLQSTPVNIPSPAPTVDSDVSYHSDGEFPEDSLLTLLRQQRSQYLRKLELIETKLQEMNN